MASTQCYSDCQNTRGFVKPSTDRRYHYKKSTYLTEKVKGIVHSARNKLHHHGSDVPFGQPVASHPQSGSQVPNKGQPVAGHTQNGLQVPNKGQPVAGQTQKPELDLFHVDSYNYVNPEKKKVEGFVSPQQNVHVEKTKQENYDSETETETETESDDEAPVTKAQPVASHVQKPTTTTFNMASINNANTVMKKDQAPVLPKQTVQEQKVEYYYSETETDSDSDDEASNKKY